MAQNLDFDFTLKKTPKITNTPTPSPVKYVLCIAVLQLCVVVTLYVYQIWLIFYEENMTILPISNIFYETLSTKTSLTKKINKLGMLQK